MTTHRVKFSVLTLLSACANKMSSRKRSSNENISATTPKKRAKSLSNHRTPVRTSSNTSSPRFRPQFDLPTNRFQSQYKDGNICKITLENFMTHGSLTIEPNARVNLITGVNGSGKSSILQAIVIGLGRNFIIRHELIRLMRRALEAKIDFFPN